MVIWPVVVTGIRVLVIFHLTVCLIITDDWHVFWAWEITATCVVRGTTSSTVVKSGTIREFSEGLAAPYNSCVIVLANMWVTGFKDECVKWASFDQFAITMTTWVVIKTKSGTANDPIRTDIGDSGTPSTRNLIYFSTSVMCRFNKIAMYEYRLNGWKIRFDKHSSGYHSGRCNCAVSTLCWFLFLYDDCFCNFRFTVFATVLSPIMTWKSKLEVGFFVVSSIGGPEIWIFDWLGLVV